MRRKEVLYAVIGGVVGAVLVMAAGSFSPLGAQNDVAAAEFGTITCRRLVVRYDGFPYATEINPISVTVSDEDGRSATLRAHGVSVRGENGKGKAAMTVMGEHVAVSLSGEDGEGKAAMTVMGEHVAVSLSGEDGEGSVYMTVGDRSGVVTVGGEEGEVFMTVNDHGGIVTVGGKDGEGSALMALDENGGYVGVFGKGSDTTRAIMAVNEYGNGAVSTWDKNGYRLATLK